MTSNEPFHAALIVDTKNDWASTSTGSPQRNIEGVVNVHANQTTTTSEAETRLDVITSSKRKLITSETENAPQHGPQHQRSCCGRPFSVNNNFKTARAPWRLTLGSVDVTGHSYDDVHTTFSRLAIVEEGIRELPPSSFEISFPSAAQPQT